jgi:Tfp pilus assembly protein PilX
MCKEANKISNKRDRVNERGAALVTVLMVSVLLITVSGALLLSTATNSSNMTDSLAEEQAYYAAESGIQTALNALRGNVVPSPLLDATKPASDAANQIDFKKALALATSNTANNTSGQPNLSRWISYNYTPSGNSFADRVTLGTGTYTTFNGLAFNLQVINPDSNGTISYSTSAVIEGGVANSRTFGSGGNTATITYNSTSVSNLNVASLAATSYGSFSISKTGSGATIATDVRFTISVNMTTPYTGTKEIRGYIKAGIITAASVGTVKFDFDSALYDLYGSQLTLNTDPLVPILGATTISGTISAVEPRRIILRALGYGPRAARKQIDAIVQKNFFNGMSAPATLSLIGPSAGFSFSGGNSQNVTYNGDDISGNSIIPPVGVTNPTNLATVNANMGNKTNVIGTPSDVSNELPEWLQSAQNLDGIIRQLRSLSQYSNRYFPANASPADLGDNVTGHGITFIDGNASLNQSGGGILIVTGTLTLRGGFDFNGLVIVTGAGGLIRSGGGNGLIQGNTVIAPYDATNTAAGFTAPKYDISGGGTSEMRFNSSSMNNGMTAVSNFVLGVAEK